MSKKENETDKPHFPPKLTDIKEGKHKWENPPEGFKPDGSYTPYKDKSPYHGFIKTEPGYNFLIFPSKAVRRIPVDTEARKHMKEASGFFLIDEWPAISSIASLTAAAYPISNICQKEQTQFMECKATNNSDPRPCRKQIESFYFCQKDAKKWLYEQKNCKKEYDYYVNCEDARGHIFTFCRHERLSYRNCVEEKMIQQGIIDPWKSNSDIANVYKKKDLDEFYASKKNI